MPADAVPATLWLPGLAGAGSEIVLGPEDAHYVSRVCRAQAGERFEATDGEGSRATLTLLSARGEVRARVESLRREPRPPHAVVACGAPERDRADWLVEKLAELGVAEFQPLDCERGRWERWETRRERFERLALAALRQSRGAWRLKLAEPLDPAAWAAGLTPGGGRWLADPGGTAPVPGEAGGPEAVAVGPSSGFSDREIHLLAGAGFRPIRLAPFRLRTETAAVCWAAAWAARVPAPGREG